MRALILTVITLFLIINIPLAADAVAQVRVTVTGTVELLDTNNHAGISVEFEPLSPSATRATVLSESDGFYVRSNVPVGIYNIRFSKDGYVPALIPNVFVDADVHFELKSLRPGGTASIGGVVSGVLSGDTLYTVTETLVVLAGTTLLVEGGAELQFGRQTGLIVDGDLRVEGTDDRGVLFTSAEAVPNFSDWLGVRLREGTIHLAHVRILYAHSPITSREFNADHQVDPNDSGIVTGTGERFKADYLVIDQVALHRISIDLPRISGISLSNCTARARQVSVLYIRHSSRVVVDGCEFRDGRITINGYGARDVQLSNNTIVDYRYNAIRAEYARNWSVYKTDIYTEHESDFLFYMIHGTDVYIKNNNARLRDAGRNGSYLLNLVIIGSGEITANDIDVKWTGTNYTSPNRLLRAQSSAIITDNNIDIEINRYINAFEMIRLESGEIRRNVISVRSTAEIWSNQFSVSEGVGHAFSSIVRNAIVENNQFAIHGRWVHFGGVIFDRSIVRGNTFDIRSNNDNLAYGSSHAILDSEFHHNEITARTRIYEGQPSVSHSGLIAIGSSSIRRNVIHSPSGIVAYGMTAAGSIAENMIVTRENESFGLIGTAGSGGVVVSNTIVNAGYEGTGRGIVVESEATASVLNNAVHGFDVGIYVTSATRSLMHNNISGATHSIIGSHVPPQAGNITTVNHLGTPSDIYFNTFVDPLFVAPGEGNYQLQSSSPLINAGSSEYRDPDGTRSDIGAFYFDFGNPKDFQLSASVEGGANFSFRRVERDSVEAYVVYGGISSSSLSEVAVLEPFATEFTLTGLSDNTPYFVAMRTLFTNVESIATDTLRVIPGVARSAYDVRNLNVMLGGETGDVPFAVDVLNSGSRDLAVSGSFDYVKRNQPVWSGSFHPRDESVNSGFAGVVGERYVIDTQGTYTAYSCDPECRTGSYDAFFNFADVFDSGSWTGGSHHPLYFPTLRVDGNVVGLERQAFSANHRYSIPYTGTGQAISFGTRATQFSSYWNIHGNLHAWVYGVTHGQLAARSISPDATETVEFSIPASVFSAPISTFPLYLETNDDSRARDTLLVLVVKPEGLGLSPVYFEPATGGSDSFPILISSARLDGNGLIAGDEIGVFDGEVCVGAASYSGTGNLVISTSGYQVGRQMTFKIYHSATGEVVQAEPTYSYGDGSFENLNFADVSLEATLFESLQMRLPGDRFSLISLNIDPTDRNVSQLFGGVPGLQIMQDDIGRAFIPQYGVNGIGHYDHARSYHVFRSGGDTTAVNISGRRIVRADRPVSVFGNRFNSMPNYYQFGVDVESVFADIASRIEILQDDAGRAWIPEYSINTIGATIPGKGYQLFFRGATDTTIVFPELPEFSVASKRAGVTASPSFYTGVVETGLPYQVVIASWENPLPSTIREVGLWSDGVLVGAGVVDGSTLMITTWQSDKSRGLPGFVVGETIRATAWTGVDHDSYDLRLVDRDGNTATYGQGPFASVSAAIASPVGTELALPTEFSIGANYPNPFSSRTTIEYTIPVAEQVTVEVYNVLGQRVAVLLDEQRAPGRHLIEWDAGAHGDRLTSGVYFLHVRAGVNTAVRKMVLMK